MVPNLMIGFGIDQVQAEYVAEIRLRNINREYILRRVEETGQLEKDIADLDGRRPAAAGASGDHCRGAGASDQKIPVARRSVLNYQQEEEQPEEEDGTEDYPVHLFLSQGRLLQEDHSPYPCAWAGEQKYKENERAGPGVRDYQPGGAAVLYRPAAGVQGPGGRILRTPRPLSWGYTSPPPGHGRGGDGKGAGAAGDYSGELLLFFENGKCARIPLAGYATKTNRRRLTGAYSDKSPLRALLHLREERMLAVYSTEGRAVVFTSALVPPKASRTTLGVNVLTLKPRYRLDTARFLEDTGIRNTARYRVRSVPAAGAKLQEGDREEKQMSLLDEEGAGSE